MVEVSTTLHADAPVPFGRVQPAIESIVRDGTSVASAVEGLQAERSTERDGRRGRVSKRGQEQSDQLFETIQGPLPSLVGMSPLCPERSFFVVGLRSCSTTWTYQGLANGPAGARHQDH